MRTSLRLLMITATLLGAARVSTVAAATLVELFTSQGCSSCPPADAYLGELAQRDDVVALSFHVNYWDYIGWRDPFATDATTQRQRDYGWRLAQGRVYTPQIVVDGVVHAVGSDRTAVDRAIAHSQDAAGDPLEITASPAPDGGVVLALSEGTAPEPAVVWLARYDATHTTEIPRGENRGVRLTNFNVVRALSKIGEWTGKPIEIPLSPAQMSAGEEIPGGGCAIIVQARGDGPVLAVHNLRRGEDF